MSKEEILIELGAEYSRVIAEIRQDLVVPRPEIQGLVTIVETMTHVPLVSSFTELSNQIRQAETAVTSICSQEGLDKVLTNHSERLAEIVSRWPGPVKPHK